MGPALRATARLYDQHLRLVASHFSNMFNGRANSAAYVADYFHQLMGMSEPALFVEVGAYRADASRRLREANPTCRIVAMEANPYNHAKYSAELPFAQLAIESLNVAATDRTGPVTFHLRTRSHGDELRRVTGNSSILPRVDPDVDYELITVDGISLDGMFADPQAGPVCLWIDVEGASGQVLRGATELLRRTDAVLIEVEERAMWQGQWRSLDVIEFFLAHDFTPLTRDAEYNQQYNILFVSNQFYERPDVLWSHELHDNYLVQHMGVDDRRGT